LNFSGVHITASHINQILAIFNFYVADKGLISLVNLPRLTYNNLSKSLLADSKILRDLGKVNGK
jgi:hypothetical protein